MVSFIHIFFLQFTQFSFWYILLKNRITCFPNIFSFKNKHIFEHNPWFRDFTLLHFWICPRWTCHNFSNFIIPTWNMEIVRYCNYKKVMDHNRNPELMVDWWRWIRVKNTCKYDDQTMNRWVFIKINKLQKDPGTI